MDKEKSEKSAEQKQAAKQTASAQEDEVRTQHVIDPKTGKKTAFQVKTIGKPREKKRKS